MFSPATDWMSEMLGRALGRLTPSPSTTVHPALAPAPPPPPPPPSLPPSSRLLVVLVWEPSTDLFLLGGATGRGGAAPWVWGAGCTSSSTSAPSGSSLTLDRA